MPWGAGLSLERNVPLKLDLSWFFDKEMRQVELEHFNVPAGLKLPDYCYQLPPFSRNLKIRMIYSKMDKILPEGLRFYFKEAKNGTFDERVLQVKRSKYLDGYWHSEKYFDTVKDRIRADFTLKQPLSPQDQLLADEMSANPRSVSVHIRRGDYVSDYRIISRHYICTPDYYTETMQWMKEKLGNGVVFYIFSDDPDWCRAEMKYPSDFRIISDGQRSVSHELVMMSRCRNAVMANSSFSWWGAWLIDDPEKKVIYPAKWFYRHSAPDIPLKNWLAWQHNTANDWKYIDIPYIKDRFKTKYKRELDLDDPQRFTEKLQWLRIYDRRPLYTELADKVAVRDYVAEKAGKKYLTKIYGVYEKSSEIEWDKFPNEFILKASHGSHWNIPCRNKDKFDKQEAGRKLDSWMSEDYYFKAREWQYKGIPPKILCEELLEDDNKNGLLDYKIWCFNGKPKFIEIINGPFTARQCAYYDLDWKKMDLRIGYPLNKNEIPSPAELNEMLSIAQSLSDGIPYVRVDLYNIKGRVIFGEMTFTPGSGFKNIQPPEFDHLWGQELILPH